MAILGDSQGAYWPVICRSGSDGRSYRCGHSPEVERRPTSGEFPRGIRLFLASSSELREDRDEFDLYFRRYNDQLTKKGIYLEIVRWEHFLDAISETRLQDEYNKAVRDCDIFVSLFFTKAGKFTEEEFDVALGVFKKKGKPRIFTAFKSLS